MSDMTPGQAPNPQPQAGEGQPAEQEQPKPTLSAEELATALKKTREEAAEHRRKLREAEAKLTAAEKAKAEEAERQAAEQGKYQELFESEKKRAADLEAKLHQLEHDQLKRDAAQAAGISQLWQRLQGETAEALAEDAKTLAAFVTPAPAADGQPQPRTATTQPTPAPQGQNRLTDEERRQRAAKTF